MIRSNEIRKCLGIPTATRDWSGHNTLICTNSRQKKPLKSSSSRAISLGSLIPVRRGLLTRQIDLRYFCDSEGTQKDSDPTTGALSESRCRRFSKGFFQWNEYLEAKRQNKGVSSKSSAMAKRLFYRMKRIEIYFKRIETLLIFRRSYITGGMMANVRGISRVLSYLRSLMMRSCPWSTIRFSRSIMYLDGRNTGRYPSTRFASGYAR